MILPPLMHGAAQWAAMTAMTTGQSVVFSTVTGTLRRRRGRADHRTGEGDGGDGRRRRDGAPSRRRDRTRHGRHLVAGGGGQRRCAVDPDRQAAPHRRQARSDGRRRRRILGDRRADDTHVRAGRRRDGQVQRRPGHVRGGRGPQRDPGAGSRRHRLARAAGLCAVGLQGRCDQDGGDVPRHRRCAVLGAGRSRTSSRRRRHRIARPRLGVRSTPAARRSSSRRSRRRSHRIRRWPMWSSPVGPASGGGRR